MNEVYVSEYRNPQGWTWLLGILSDREQAYEAFQSCGEVEAGAVLRVTKVVVDSRDAPGPACWERRAVRKEAA